MIRTSQEGHDHPVCPNCGAEQCGGKIYEDWAKAYHPGDPERQAEYAEGYGAGPLAEADPERKHPVAICGSKVIGIETPSYDGTSYWQYPCCGATYDRFTGKQVEMDRIRSVGSYGFV